MSVRGFNSENKGLSWEGKGEELVIPESGDFVGKSGGFGEPFPQAEAPEPEPGPPEREARQGSAIPDKASPAVRITGSVNDSGTWNEQQPDGLFESVPSLN